MKTSNKSNLLTGVILLALAALFSISLLLQLLDFGNVNPNNNNILFSLGQMLYTVYGFSSILIPTFLLISGLSCFATQWTARKTMRLLTALIPFFTCVITENVCRSIIKVSNSSFLGLKTSIAIITGLMLVVIEFLGVGILADRINGKKITFNGLRGFKSLPTKEKSFELKKFKKSPKLKRIEIPETDETIAFETEVFEENSIDETTLSDESNEITEEKFTPESEFTTQNETPQGQSLLTQEEFAALTNPEEDELEWANLPPQPEKLPPEYDEDYVQEEIDENDPALQFPPEDVESENDITFDSQETYADEEEISYETDTDNPYSANIIDLSKTKSTNLPSEDDLHLDKNDPYSATKYIDAVVENPKFPHGIVIHDENDETENEIEEKSEKPKSKFPSKIKLSDTDEDTSNDDYEEDETLPFPAFDETFENTTFESPDEFDIQKPAINSQNIEEKSLSDYFSSVDTSSTVKPVEDPYAIENENDDFEINEDFNNDEEPGIFGQIAAQESSEEIQKPTISSTAADVFSDMEADIRKTTKKKEYDANGNIVNASVLPSLNSETSTATNLTADELSDFFSTQQAENTPVTQKIQAAPKSDGHAMKKGPYIIPSDLLTAYKDDEYWVIDDATKQASLNLKQTLFEFNIEASIIGIKKGPVVTMFEILPAPGVKLSKIVALQDNIALSLAAQSVRIVAPIPGKQAVGIEVPNKNRSVVGFREIIEMDLPEWKKMAVPVILGKDILGKAQLIDLVKTPHMLIAGATGSGKSVCVNSLILSILYKRSFNDVKMILVDPKVVELKLYNNIPHLLTPVITEPKKAIQALQWCLCEMERRYALLDSMGVRDIANYNHKIKEQKICTEKLPYIVVIIDEFADLMATSGKELESIVARLTAMSRAVGIHLVLATQRPSVNVITGLIKANIPTRIAFMVASRTDSNIIIDTVGAEKLLGRGDMLYASAVDPAPIRIQGTFVSDQEVENVVTAVKEYGEPDYLDEEIFVNDDDDNTARDLFGEPMDDDDPLYDQALEIVVQEGKASASYLQRRLKIGYNRAARLVEEMEERGIVGPANGSKPREVIHIPN